MNDTKIYFDYKLTRLLIGMVCFICALLVFAWTAGRVTDRIGKPPDNEYTVQLKYIDMGYVQRTCGKCQQPAWFAKGTEIHCDIDGKVCK